MTSNDVLKFCAMVFMLSLSALILSSTGYVIHRTLHANKIEVKIDGKFDGTYLQDEIVNAVINSNIVQDEHP
jgi:hypothetical protein